MLAAAVAASAITTGGCGSSAPAVTSTATPKPTPLTPPPTRRAKQHRPRSRQVGAKIGTTQPVKAGGETVAVTIRRVIDPLRGSGASLAPRTHAVGVLVGIRNSGPGIYDSSATGDFSIVTSSGPAPPVFAPSGSCQTELRDFDNYITEDESRDGCVVFDVPNGARVTAVRFSPHAQAVGRVSWATTH